MESKQKYKVLIVEDAEMNRSLLSAILEDEYDVIEAEDGEQAVEILHQSSYSLSLVFLDIVMPRMDGFEVLACMNRYHWIDNIPVIMISAEDSSLYIQRAYEFGATDYIGKPFDAAVVRRRAANAIKLYAKQRRLMQIATDQLLEKEKNNNMMVMILSHIVEFRNGESGLHVLHVNIITELLLRELAGMTDRYSLTETEINLISMASTLHDIGKISIPSEVLNKPGKLTDEEFEQMKTHTVVGASMLENLPMYQDEPLVKAGYEICRWHHEKYDGRGYPDGLKGEEIPISAQVVSLADVYDALTSERCYKAAYTPEQALEMIEAGLCGAFNPILLKCLEKIWPVLKSEFTVNSFGGRERQKRPIYMDEILQSEDMSESVQLMAQLAYEQRRAQFFADACQDMTFTWNMKPTILMLPKHSAARLGLPENVVNPETSQDVRQCLGRETIARMLAAPRQTSPAAPAFSFDCAVRLDGDRRPCRCQCQAIWVEAEQPQCMGVAARLRELDKEEAKP